jgi:hypothetical protein
MKICNPPCRRCSPTRGTPAQNTQDSAGGGAGKLAWEAPVPRVWGLRRKRAPVKQRALGDNQIPGPYRPLGHQAEPAARHLARSAASGRGALGLRAEGLGGNAMHARTEVHVSGADFRGHRLDCCGAAEPNGPELHVERLAHEFAPGKFADEFAQVPFTRETSKAPARAAGRFCVVRSPRRLRGHGGRKGKGAGVEFGARAESTSARGRGGARAARLARGAGRSRYAEARTREVPRMCVARRPAARRAAARLPRLAPLVWRRA